jgi:hypothetical protein
MGTPHHEKHSCWMMLVVPGKCRLEKESLESGRHIESRKDEDDFLEENIRRRETVQPG